MFVKSSSSSVAKERLKLMMESDALEYLHEEVTPEPTPEKKKCGKKSAEIIIAVLAAASVAYVFLRKRK